MRSFTFLLATAAVAGSTSTFGFSPRQLNLPTCALPCLTATSSTSFGNCSSTDDACLCSNPQFISNTATCIEGACTGNDLQTALSAAEALCAQAGVTLDPSSILASVSTTATTPLASAGSGSASANPSATTSGPSSSTNGALYNGVFPEVLLSVVTGVVAWVAF
ncbi:hypothetical protein C8R41DRAFT_846171 [Lentinula lateritia]|uniref:CFEM domain-containing protein n=1 Tax=Lentinula lateritia TaxID=40482 RepID=A0ABQ8V642_9AGAR|nr:hypothetical protein C8R41DRAFT_846171 [Lentinula lateritia]